MSSYLDSIRICDAVNSWISRLETDRGNVAPYSLGEYKIDVKDHPDYEAGKGSLLAVSVTDANSAAVFHQQHTSHRAAALKATASHFRSLPRESTITGCSMRKYGPPGPHPYTLQRPIARFLEGVSADETDANDFGQTFQAALPHDGGPRFKSFEAGGALILPDGPAGGGAAANLAAMASTLGRPIAVRATDPYNDSLRTHATLADTRTEVMTHSNWLITRIKSEDVWHFELISPWTFAEGKEAVIIDTYEFGDYTGMVLPYESASRMTEYKTYRRSYGRNRQGLSHMMEYEAWLTALGRKIWDYQKQQLVNAMVIGAMFGVILELLTSDVSGHHKSEIRNEPTSKAEFECEMAKEIALWNIMMKPDGMKRLAAHLDQIFRLRKVRDDQRILILPDGCGFFINAHPLKRVFYLSGIGREEIAPWTTPPRADGFAHVVYQPPIKITSHQDPDVMYKPCTIGMMRWFDPQVQCDSYNAPYYESSHTTYKWYCDETDGREPTTFDDFISYSLVYDTERTVGEGNNRKDITPFGFALFKQKLPSIHVDSSIWDYWEACGVTNRHRSIDPILKGVIRHLNSSKAAGAASATTDQAKDWLKAKPLRWSGSWKTLIQHNIPFPFQGLEFVPHATYTMGTAVACLRHCSRTLYDRPKYLVGINKKIGTVHGSAIWHFRSACTDSREVIVQDGVVSAGYVCGNNKNIWKPEHVPVYTKRQKHTFKASQRSTLPSRFMLWLHPGTWSETNGPRWYMDITGRPAAGQIAEFDSEPLSTGLSGELYTKEWKWRAHQTLDTVKGSYFSAPLHLSNTIVCQDAQWFCSVGADGHVTWDRMLRSQGHFGDITYPGCRAKRSGNFLTYNYFSDENHKLKFVDFGH